MIGHGRFPSGRVAIGPFESWPAPEMRARMETHDEQLGRPRPWCGLRLTENRQRKHKHAGPLASPMNSGTLNKVQ